MAVRLFAMTCGWLTGHAGGFLSGETGRLRVPVPSFLIDHPRGKVLFDSGLHPDTGPDPEGRLGMAAKFFEVELAPGEDVAGRLAALDVDPGAIRHLVTSHLHFDHTGGNGALRNATVVVQRAEWEAGHDPDAIRANFYDPRDYDTGQDVALVTGEHDLFGDGRVVCIPTYGHTPGHQSLRVRLESGEVILTADACYLRRTLEELHLPSIVHDRAAMLASLLRLRALRDAGARLVYGHDPECWATVPQAPAELT
ncbi:MAG TPA: N-acyl homoserine lactonase family protein [Candidatus Binatus sp.]|nr:N-acyl homoserine lactonase family protein [Candidatus Binatus sp.]